MLPPALIKKTLTFSIGTIHPQLFTSQSLFSSFAVDAGSQLLLKSLVTIPKTGEKILDLGCGYGVVGLSLKALDGSRDVTLIDRDNLAVEFSAANASHNNLTVRTLWGIGYDPLSKSDRDFDLIVSNIPAKAGEGVITSLLLDAQAFLKPGGRVAIVVISRLVPFVRSILTQTNGVVISFEKETKSYCVFHYSFPTESAGNSTSAFSRGIYFRGTAKFAYKELRYFLTTAYGLSEFDELDFQSQLIISEFLRIPNWKISSALVSNGGVGHSAFLVAKFYSPSLLMVVDRDKLALLMARHNLETSAEITPPQIIEQTSLPKEQKRFDLLILKLREEEGREFLAQEVAEALPLLTERGKLMVTGSSTAITRLISDTKNARVERREKLKGESIVVFTP